MKRGVYTKQGTKYEVYEISKSSYYRLEIHKKGGRLFLDVDTIVYGRFSQKGQTFEYGDRDIYDSWMTFMMQSSVVKAQIDVKEEWLAGDFTETKTRINIPAGLQEEIIERNGKLTSMTTVYKDSSYTYVVESDPATTGKPINFEQYKNIQLSEPVTDAAYYDMDYLRAKYDLSHLDEYNFEVADTLDLARERLNKIVSSGEDMYGLDLETTGLDVWRLGKDKIVGIVVGAGTSMSTYFPFRMNKIDNLPLSFMGDIINALKGLQYQGKKIVNHNIKFDRQGLLKEGYDVFFNIDTHVWSIMLDPVITEKGRHALKNLVHKRSGKTFLELSDIFVDGKTIAFNVLPKDITKYYACPDSTSAVKLVKSFEKETPKFMLGILDVEFKLANLIAEQEFYGMRINSLKFHEEHENNVYILNKLETLFRTWTREVGKISSPDVLATLIYDKLRCPVMQRTSTGKRSTSVKAIQYLTFLKLEEPNPAINFDILDKNGKVILSRSDLDQLKYPALKILLLIKEYTKRITSFYNRLDKSITESCINFAVNQNGASSGRESSNMHQLPPELKDTVISDSKFHDLWDADYSQIELRLIAGMAGETELIEACSDPDIDIHRLIASMIVGKPMCEITKKERSSFKAVNFGVVYMVSARGLAVNMYGPTATKEQIAECQQNIDAFFNRFLRIKKFMSENAVKLHKTGTMHTYFGRIKNFFEIFDETITRRKKGSLERQANNFPVQGTGADVIKIAQLNVYNYIKAKGWDKINEDTHLPTVRCALSIHDELMVMADKTIVKEEILKMFKECMEISIKGFPPLFVSPALCDTWEGHNDDSLAMPVPLRNKLIEDYEKTGKTVFKSSTFVKDKETGDWKYKDGDWVTELPKNTDTLGLEEITVTNYRDVIDDYRDSVLRNYMMSMKEQYGDDIGAHIDHPTLTHELIGMFHKELASLHLSHREQIIEAARLYFSEERVTTETSFDFEKDIHFDVPLDLIEPIYNFDENGDIIIDEVETEEEDVLLDTPEDVDFYAYDSSPIYTLTFSDKMVIDISLVPEKDVNEVIEEIWNLRSPKAFYNVQFIYDKKVLDAGFKVDAQAETKIKDIVERRIQWSEIKL